MKFYVWQFMLFSCVLSFQQQEYKVMFERLEAVSCNTSYITLCRTYNFKYNRTHTVVNLTLNIIRDLGNQLEVNVDSYKMASNEYRYFPIRFNFGLCRYAAANEFGLRELSTCGNFSCPLNKGIYRSCNWSPNSNKYPPNVPEGKYKHDLKLFYGSVEVLFLQMYASVKYPEVKGFSV